LSFIIYNFYKKQNKYETFILNENKIELINFTFDDILESM